MLLRLLRHLLHNSAEVLCWMGLFCPVLFHLTAAAAEPKSSGIDVILLIDVSGSMSQVKGDLRQGYNEGRWDGADTLRIRWDAVKRLIDLLDANDRILVLRFNERCPARRDLANSYTPALIQDSQAYLPNGKLLTPELDFPSTWKACDGGQHSFFSQRIAEFNRPLSSQHVPGYQDHHDGWSLDNGGTNILDALRSLAMPTTGKAIYDRPERPKRIILLTDGCDQNIDRYVNPGEGATLEDYEPQLRTDQLKSELSFLISPQQIPVYTIGLKLNELSNESDPKGDSYAWIADEKREFYTGKHVPPTRFQQTKAIALLEGISEITGGKRLQADQASELLTLYTELIRDLKGLWFKQAVIPPATRELSIPVVSAVADFRMLAQVRIDSPPTLKEPSRPPSFRPGFWRTATTATEAERRGITPGQLRELADSVSLRQGTGASLYALWFGGNLRGPTAPGFSEPFALLNGPVEWVVPITEDQPIETVQFKRVLEDFGWPPRGVGQSRFYRHQLAELTFEATGSLSAQDFDWQLSERDRPSAAQLPIIFQASGTQAKRGVFQAGQLSPQGWSATVAEQHHAWNLVADGHDPSLKSQVLAGFRRKFDTAWEFRVANELPLRTLEDKPRLSLAEGQPKQFVTIRTQFDRAIPSIPLRARLIPPKIRSKENLPLTDVLKLFQLSLIDAEQRTLPLNWNPDGSVGFPLIDGQARLQLEFVVKEKGRISPGATIESGELVIEPAVTDLYAPSVSTVSVKRIPVELVIDRPPLAFYDDQQLTQRRELSTASPNPATANQIRLFIAPTKPIGIGRQFTLSLHYLDPPRAPDGTEDRFRAGEFRILDREGREIPQKAGNWDLEYTGKPISITLEAQLEAGRDRLSDSTATGLLRAEGDGFSSGELKLRWTFEPRIVTVSLDPAAPVPLIEPGQLAEFVVTGQVENNPDGLTVSMAEAILKNGLLFRNQVEDQPNFVVLADDIRNATTIAVNGMKPRMPAKTILAIRIPASAACGNYQATVMWEDVAVVGLDASKKYVPIRLKEPEVIFPLKLDRLILEMAHPHEPARWIAARRVGDELQLSIDGWRSSQMTREIRVRSELGESLRGTERPDLPARITMKTEVNRPAAEDLVVEADAMLPLWKLNFQTLHNRDPSLPFNARFTISRNGALSRAVTLKLHLLELPESAETPDRLLPNRSLPDQGAENAPDSPDRTQSPRS